MPLIKQRPSFNHEVIRGMTKQELIDMHPDADEDYVSAEWEKAGGTGEDKAEPKKVGKEKGV